MKLPSDPKPEGLTLHGLEAALVYARACGATDESPVMLEHLVHLDENASDSSLSYVEDGSLLQANITQIKAESRCEEGPPTVYVGVEPIHILTGAGVSCVHRFIQETK